MTVYAVLENPGALSQVLLDIQDVRLASVSACSGLVLDCCTGTCVYTFGLSPEEIKPFMDDLRDTASKLASEIESGLMKKTSLPGFSQLHISCQAGHPLAWSVQHTIMCWLHSHIWSFSQDNTAYPNKSFQTAVQAFFPNQDRCVTSRVLMEN